MGLIYRTVRLFATTFIECQCAARGRQLMTNPKPGIPTNFLKNKSGKLISFFITFQHYQQTWQLTHFNEPYSQNYLGQCWSTIRSLSNAADLFCERNFFSISVIHFVAASTKHRIHHLQNQKRKNGKDWESVCVCACT